MERPVPRKPITCTTDSRVFAAYGIPATCFGLADTRSIHGIDESISLQSLRDVARVYALFIADYCGLMLAPTEETCGAFDVVVVPGSTEASGTTGSLAATDAH